MVKKFFNYSDYCYTYSGLKKSRDCWLNIVTAVQFVCVESLVTAVVDMYPRTFRVGYRRELLILGMSVASYILGLTMLTEVRKMEKW